MKTVQVFCITLALLASFASCVTDDGGYHVINTPASDDPNSCLLSLNFTVQTDGILFTAVQSSQPAGSQNCAHQDLIFAPLFRNAPSFDGKVVLNGSGNTLTGKLTKTLFTQFDGKACANLGLYAGLTWLKCRFKYGRIYFSVDWYMKANGDYDTAWTGLLYPAQAQTISNGSGNSEVLRANNSYQELVGMTYSACGSWSSFISDTSKNITITGTQYQSIIYDLSKDLSGMNLYAIIVRSVATGAYKVKQFPTYYPFASPAAGNCYTLKSTYADVIQGLNCAGGCNLVLLMYGATPPAKEFDLMNQGFFTA